jgi:hypothetical protein
LESEYDEAEEENKKCDSSERIKEVAPAHIIALRAALTRRYGVACWEWVVFREVRTARVLWNETICDCAANYNANRLEYREERKHVSLILRRELKGDCCIDWDVSSNAETNEGCEDKNASVGVWDCEAEPKYRGNEDCEIESPLATCDEAQLGS